MDNRMKHIYLNELNKFQIVTNYEKQLKEQRDTMAEMLGLCRESGSVKLVTKIFNSYKRRINIFNITNIIKSI